MLLIGWVVQYVVVDWLGGFQYVVDWLFLSVLLIGWVFQYVVDWLGGSVCC